MHLAKLAQRTHDRAQSLLMMSNGRSASSDGDKRTTAKIAGGCVQSRRCGISSRKKKAARLTSICTKFPRLKVVLLRWIHIQDVFSQWLAVSPSLESEFNRATQAMRQPGSSFKPFVYSAALDNGYTPASVVLDGPISVDQGGSLGVWAPKNYSGKFAGPSTLALRH